MSTDNATGLVTSEYYSVTHTCNWICSLSHYSHSHYNVDIVYACLTDLCTSGGGCGDGRDSAIINPLCGACSDGYYQWVTHLPLPFFQIWLVMLYYLDLSTVNRVMTVLHVKMVHDGICWCCCSWPHFCLCVSSIEALKQRMVQ
jgi:hypothetical protein